MKKQYKYTLVEEGGRVDIYQADTFLSMVIKVLKDKFRRRITCWKH